MTKPGGCIQCEPPICHENQPEKAHCTGGIVACGGAHCP
jgi:hypothetical protein